MEQARILLAIALSFAVFLIWEIFFVERPPEAPLTEQAQQTAAKTPTAAESEPAAKPELDSFSPEALPFKAVSKAAGNAKRITVETPLYTAVLSETGATIRSWRLKQYREEADPGAAPKELVGEQIPGGTVQTSWGKPVAAPMEKARFFLESGETEVKVTNLGRSVRFSWQSPEGVRVEKTYAFSPESYLVDLSVTIQNGSGRPLANDIGISLLSRFEESGRAIGFEGASALVDDRVEQIDVDDVDEETPGAGKLQWISLQHRYFLSALMPVQPVETKLTLSSPAPGLVESRYTQPVIELAPGTQKQFDYQLFFGPKSMKVLGEVGYDLDRVLDFGWFDFIAKPCLWLMNFIYRFIPNYGVAIICLTLITKILLWPLGNKSYKSMGEMKKIQPLMAEIREKYKNDKKKMNQEMMALYRTYKINPVGGCLPMAAQIPVFIALYRMLYGAIELRHAPFFGWINDLSAPDRLFEFPFSIPFMQEPYGIPVLTLVMGASMLLQQKMSPPPGDPSQAKMMMLMPVVFTVIFINFPSGLVLYWLVNNLFSMAQQYYTQKKHA
ncbi:MAG: membrane protein insertase YidC [Desulfobacterales bacterium]|nr:membrane protein insertase YidC [Desulfobacterales bacterium]